MVFERLGHLWIAFDVVAKLAKSFGAAFEPKVWATFATETGACRYSSSVGLGVPGFQSESIR